jgi:hypothetical protein
LLRRKGERDKTKDNENEYILFGIIRNKFFFKKKIKKLINENIMENAENFD